MSLGVRAENIEVLRDDRSTEALRATVQVVEPLGAATLLTVDIDGQVLKAQTPPTVRSEALLLDGWMDWITKQDWVGELETELREVRDQLRSETGEPNPKPIGYCINTLDEGEHTRECQAPLFAPREGTALRCHHCGREYDGLDLVKLELAQEAR